MSLPLASTLGWLPKKDAVRACLEGESAEQREPLRSANTKPGTAMTTSSPEFQYDKKKQVFWATGAATLLRREALDRVGLLAESFFAHMEEIDLDWRLQWAGYRVVIMPNTVVYHQTGATLGQSRFQKMVLNHRNSLLMVLRNHTVCTLLWILPLRLMLEFITLIASFLIGQPRRSLAESGGNHRF